jgi:lipopolysaccharide export system permease protein
MVGGPEGKEAGVILDRMLFFLQGRMLLAVLAVLLVLGLTIDFFESARYLFSVEGTAGDVFLFYLCKIPLLMHMLLPISLVIGSCICFAVLGRSLQLRAFAAAGIGPLRLAAPTTALAVLVVGATFMLAEFVVPPALDRSEKLMLESFKEIDQTWRFYRKHYWYQGEADRLFRISQVERQGCRLRGVMLLEMDPDFHVRVRSDIGRVLWKGDHWVGQDIQARTFEDGRQVSLRAEKEMRLEWPERPGRFRDLRGRPKQKSLSELSLAIDDLDRRGLSAARYRMEYHSRFAYPLLGLALILLALLWLCDPSRRRTLAGALIESTGLLFGAYFLVMMATAAVTGGALSVALGVWFPVVLILVLALLGWTARLKQRRLGTQ